MSCNKLHPPLALPEILTKIFAYLAAMKHYVQRNVIRQSIVVYVFRSYIMEKKWTLFDGKILK